MDAHAMQKSDAALFVQSVEQVAIFARHQPLIVTANLLKNG